MDKGRLSSGITGEIEDVEENHREESRNVSGLPDTGAVKFAWIHSICAVIRAYRDGCNQNGWKVIVTCGTLVSSGCHIRGNPLSGVSKEENLFRISWGTDFK